MSESDSELKPTELMIPAPSMARPAFANLVQSNVARVGSERPIWTLSFVHIFPNPTGPSTSEMSGEIVARVALTTETAQSLVELLQRQMTDTAGGLIPSGEGGT